MSMSFPCWGTGRLIHLPDGRGLGLGFLDHDYDHPLLGDWLYFSSLFLHLPPTRTTALVWPLHVAFSF